MRKNRNDQLFGKIFFLPVMTKKMVKTKEHCSPTRSKAVFVQHVVERKKRKKTVAAITQAYP